MNNIFNKIINHKIKSNILYQDNIVTAFKDKNPQAPIHILIVSNKLIPTMNELKNEKDKMIIGHMLIIAVKLAKKQKIEKSGYRLIINCNKNAGQEIYHLHIHLLGGKKLGKIIN
ncbi:histidine triad nucleotide-binding protein [Candidatus Purcelliella pentastirinorum]|uniref:Histidine triad nucleotide-binding protein n=1 Tax=Candidatus Purcelliella pentastirinorum TaxID=472834 RepID=A0AAX3N842_9ENTR|nr:histidine triad nucleotide-binding protein [Candidatus Purcelliella pentastirinorum]WDI78619.1 histidine triad nucleotide-binding protein [Candidatus Purcelliella pentastirinorum]WDR80353.1 histidine triad nucleotide-binding protein [Candidatus Purcelliella pentastirinorum]